MRDGSWTGLCDLCGDQWLIEDLIMDMTIDKAKAWDETPDYGALICPDCYKERHHQPT